ncbi:hypothetical protein JMUB7503_27320 [Staphylococcus aureus]
MQMMYDIVTNVMHFYEGKVSIYNNYDINSHTTAMVTPFNTFNCRYCINF